MRTNKKTTETQMCGAPDSIECGRKSTLEFSYCTFCTKNAGGCDFQKPVVVTFLVSKKEDKNDGTILDRKASRGVPENN